LDSTSTEEKYEERRAKPRRERGFAKPVSERTKVLVLSGSAVAVFVLVLVATFVYPTYYLRPGYDNAMLLILIAGLIPPSFLNYIDRRYKGAVDSKIPDFLREVIESQRAGATFTKSLQNAAESNYGPLSSELRRAMAKMSWGFTFEDALSSFADTAGTPLAHRAAVLLEEVGRAGGRILEVLDSVYEHIREVINLQRERAKQLAPYTIVIYSAFGVYLFVVFILFTTFFAQITNLQQSGAPFGTGISAGVYYIWFYHMTIIEAVFGGLVAGKISTGSAVSGLKNVLVLLSVAFVVFTFFIKY